MRLWKPLSTAAVSPIGGGQLVLELELETELLLELEDFLPPLLRQ